MDGWDDNLEGWESNKNKYDVSDIKIDLIIVLAGGLNDEGKVNEWVRGRLERAIELHKINNCPILCCGGGTYHKPPYTNEQGFVIHESTECVNYLIQRNIKPTNILREWSSYDTIANSFFSLTNHLWCKENWKNIAIITSEFHLPRAKEIFDWIYNLDSPMCREYNLTYFSVTDVGLNEDMLKERKKREKNSRLNIIKLKQTITSVSDFHQWLYKEHNAYNNQPIISDISIDCKNSY